MANDQAVLLRLGRRARRHRVAAGLGFGLLGLLVLIFLVIDDGNLLDAVGDVGPLTRALVHTFGGGAAFVLLYIEESGVPMVVPGDFVVMWVGHHVPREIAAWTGAWVGLVAAVVLVLHAQRTSRLDSTPAAYLAAVMSSPVGRWLVLLLWLWVGWHFFVR